METLRAFLGLTSASLKTVMAYRVSFLLEVAGRFFVTGTQLVALFILFQRFPTIMGWTLWEVVYLYGVASVCFGFVEMACAGLASVPQQIQSGDFDRVLVRPLSPLLQSLSSQVELLDVGRLLQGVLALVLANHHLDINWTSRAVCMLALSLACGVLIYAGLFVIKAALCFFTIEGQESLNAFSYGGVELTQYPVSIYDPWLRSIFLFVIPVGFVSYFPALMILGKQDPMGFPSWSPYLSPFVAVAFALAAAVFWRAGIRHYQSTGP